MKAYGTNQAYNVSFETWLSCDTDPELSDLSSPLPSKIRHHIKVLPIAGHSQHYEVFGLIAAGYPQLAYDDPNSANGISDQWNKAVRYVTSAGGEAAWPMKVDPGQMAARILAVDVTLNSSWTPPISILTVPLVLPMNVT